MCERYIINLFAIYLYGLCFVRTILAIYYWIVRDRWQTTPAKVIHTELVTKRVRRGYGSKGYQALIEFEYIVDDVVYRSNWFSFAEKIGSWRDPYYPKKHAEFLLKNYPVNSDVSILYNPRNPSKAVLENSVFDSGSVLFIVGFVVMSLIALCVVSSGQVGGF